MIDARVACKNRLKIIQYLLFMGEGGANITLNLDVLNTGRAKYGGYLCGDVLNPSKSVWVCQH